MKANKGLWIALVLAAAAGWRTLSRRQDRPQFLTTRVEKGNLSLTILATGVVQPQNRVEIKPPIAGRADDILVKEGQAVRKGQILAWMSSVERAALLDAARAKGPEELAHWEDLYKPTPLVAPLEGLVISRKVEPGQTVTAQDPVLVMSNRLIVKGQVDETDIGKIRQGQEAEVVLDAYPQEKIAARVDHVAYEAKTVSNVTVYEVDVVPRRVPDFMRSGMTANVVFLVARKEDVLVLPAEAVRQEKDRSVVLLPDPKGNGRPVSKEIETGMSDGKRIEVVSGLKEGDLALVRAFRLPKGQASQGSPFSPVASRSRGERAGRNQGGQR